jgi:hypothetical protein
MSGSSDDSCLATATQINTHENAPVILPAGALGLANGALNVRLQIASKIVALKS